MLSQDTLYAMNLLRVAITSLVLFYSCVTDWKSRRAPNRLWFILGGAGLILNAYDFWAREFSANFLFLLFIGVAFIYAFVYLLFRMRAFGGADAKALIAIAVVFPYYPFMDVAGYFLPLSDGLLSPIFSLAVMGNAVVLTLIVPVVVAIYNIFTTPFSEIRSNPVGLFTGYRMKPVNIKGKHVRLMHRYEEVDGNVVRKMVFGGKDTDPEIFEKLEKWQKEGKLAEKVWVTPKLPFLIPITIGFLVAVIYGDLLMQILSIVLYR